MHAPARHYHKKKLSTPNELTSRNANIVTDVSLEVSRQRLNDWKEDSAPQLEFHWLNRIHVSQELCKSCLDPVVVTDLRSQQQELDATIVDLVRKRKDLEADLSLKWKCAAKATSNLKEQHIMVENLRALIVMSWLSLQKLFLNALKLAYSLFHILPGVMTI
jgi:hypothetical protein